MRPEMKCDDAFEAISAGLDGELGDTERPRLRHHLAGCDRCRARDAELRAVHRQMRLLRVDEKAVRPPQRLRVRIERDCRPMFVFPRFSPFAFGIALTGAGALGALLALAFRSPAPAGTAELAAQPVDPHAGRSAGPAPRAPRPAGGAVMTARAEPLAAAPVETAQAPEHLAPVTPPPAVTAGPAPAAGPAAPVPAAAGPAVSPAAPAAPLAAVTSAAANPPEGSPPAPRPAAAAAPGCVPPPAPVLVQLEAPPQPAATGTPAVHATLATCGLDPAVVKALTGQTIQLQNTGPGARQIQIDQQPAPGAAYAEGDRQSVPAGATIAHSFERPGLYPVWCDGGGQPCGYLAVAAHPQFAVVEEQPAPSAPLAVQFAGAPAAAGPRPVAVYQSRRRALAGSLTLDANGVGQLRMDPAAGLPLPALNDCRLVRERQTPVAHACMRGGIKEAKRAMKALVKRAKDRGLKFECDNCHRNEVDWQLTDDARANFNSMLAAAGT